MDLEKAHSRYRNDPEFNRLVQCMISWIKELRFSPGELRETAVYAEYLVHMEERGLDSIV